MLMKTEMYCSMNRNNRVFDLDEITHTAKFMVDSKCYGNCMKGLLIIRLKFNKKRLGVETSKQTVTDVSVMFKVSFNLIYRGTLKPFCRS